MTAYIIAEIDVQDPTAYEEYKRQVPASIAAHGGRYVARGGRAECLEGGPAPKRIVVLEFPDYERAKAWWGSAEYAGPKALRQSASAGRLVVVDGAPASRGAGSNAAARGA